MPSTSYRTTAARRVTVVYEFVVECRDEHGDIIDTIPWDTAEQAATCYCREVQSRDWHRVELAVVRDEWCADQLVSRTHHYPARPTDPETTLAALPAEVRAELTAAIGTAAPLWQLETTR